MPDLQRGAQAQAQQGVARSGADGLPEGILALQRDTGFEARGLQLDRHGQPQTLRGLQNALGVMDGNGVRHGPELTGEGPD